MAVRFNAGVSDGGEIALGLSAAHTLSGWFRVTDEQDYNSRIFECGPVIFSAFEGGLVLFHSSTFDEINPPETIVANTWYRCAVSWDGAGASVVRVGAGRTGTLVSQAGNVAGEPAGTLIFGSLSDVELAGWHLDNGELSVAQLEASRWPFARPRTPTWASYPLEHPSSYTRDASGNGRPLAGRATPPTLVTNPRGVKFGRPSSGDVLTAPAVGAPAYVDGAGASSGVATAAGDGEVVVNGAGASSGQATTAAAGQIVVPGAGTASGQATSTGDGQVVVEGAGSAAGTATTAGDGELAADYVDGAGTAAGSATTAGDGEVVVVGAGTAAGAATAAGTGQVVVAGQGASAGAATSGADGQVVVVGAGTAAGAATSAGDGEIAADYVDGAGTAAGVATAAGDGEVVVEGAGASAGAATSGADGQVVVLGSGSAAGSATTAGDGEINAGAAGHSSGGATTAGDGQVVVEGAGASTGGATTAANGGIAGQAYLGQQRFPRFEAVGRYPRFNAA